MKAADKNYTLGCRNCGQKGILSISTHGQLDWSFATVGFIGLAVNRYNPANSVLRCNNCGSPVVSVEPVGPDPVRTIL